MADTPPPKRGNLFIVSEFRDDKWHHLLTTKNEAETRELLKSLGERGKLDELKPRPPKRR